MHYHAGRLFNHEQLIICVVNLQRYIFGLHTAHRLRRLRQSGEHFLATSNAVFGRYRLAVQCNCALGDPGLQSGARVIAQPIRHHTIKALPNVFRKQLQPLLIILNSTCLQFLCFAGQTQRLANACLQADRIARPPKSPRGYNPATSPAVWASRTLLIPQRTFSILGYRNSLNARRNSLKTNTLLEGPTNPGTLSNN